MKVSIAATAALAGSVSATEFQDTQHVISGDAVMRAKPMIDSKQLQSLISKDNLLSRAENLYKIAKLSEDEYNHPTRVIDSAGHNGTLDYIFKAIANMSDYYTLAVQPFSAFSGGVFESRLVLGNTVSISAIPMSLTPPTPHKQPVFGHIVLAHNDGCKAEDFPKETKGNIALIRRGSCAFGDKSANAGRAGASAAVIYDNAKGSSFSGTMGQPLPEHVATFGITLAEAEPVIAELKKGKKVDGIAYIDAFVKTIITNNIIAQTIDGDQDNCVMIGGHSDSVAEGPGINDDGSGSLTVLEVATQLTHFRVANCVRFAWWAGEEEGLLGSDHYVEVLPDEENLKIRLFLDYDMMGSPNYAYQVYNATNKANPEGSEEIKQLYIDWYESQGLNYTLIPFDGRSDYDGFIRNGIPGGGIATGAEGIKTKEEAKMFGGKAGEWYDPCYHQLCDDVANVNLTAWEVNTKLVAHSVATFAKSFEGFPKRTLKKDVGVASSAPVSRYHGHKLRA